VNLRCFPKHQDGEVETTGILWPDFKTTVESSPKGKIIFAIEDEDDMSALLESGFVLPEHLDQAKDHLLNCAEPDTIIENRYAVFENKGVVVDRTTGLMWKRAIEEGEFTFDGAQQHAAAVNAGGGFAGHDDWRVPTIDELKSIVDPDRKDPAIHPEAFPGTRSRWFWTSTPYEPDPAYAWLVDFGNGITFAYNKTNTFQVRLVRSGQ
jgi:hypothetical protein